MKTINRILVLLIVVIYTVVFVTTAHAKSLAGYGSDETETERPYSDDDFYEMSHVIQAEAGYCSWEMMVGVGSVVMNRVKSDKFPDTVYEVIHQSGQYSCVRNGSFNNEPTRGKEMLRLCVENRWRLSGRCSIPSEFSSGNGNISYVEHELLYNVFLLWVKGDKQI